MSRRFLSLVLGILLLLPALAPGRDASAWAEEMGKLEILRIDPPTDGTDIYTLCWRDLGAVGLYDGVKSLTWYYSTRRDGSDRKRLTTTFRDEFGPDFARRWRNEGATNLDWIVRRDGRQFLSVPGGALPSRTISREPLIRDAVVSALVRPRDLKSGFSLALRMGQNGGGYLLTTGEKGVRFTDGAREIENRSTAKINPNTWYWYEVGLKTRKDEVVIRVRVFDETRTRLLVKFDDYDRPQNKALLSLGGIALSGPADFAEVYADPWEACWLDACANQLSWDTGNVPTGDYYIIAEVADGLKPPYRAVSSFQVKIRKAPPGDMARSNDP